MLKKDSLGKGLGAIFPDLIDNLSDKPIFALCGIEELLPNRFQPRKDFDGDEHKNLVKSIKRNGIIQPIIVRKSGLGYEIVAGERRWRAAQDAGLDNVPIIIRDAEDIDMAELSLIENIQREELNPIEEAEAYQTLIKKFNFSQEELSISVGKDRSTIANSIRLLKLPKEVKDALIRKEISAGHARAILSFKFHEEQIEALHEILKRKLSVRESENLAKKLTKNHSEKNERKKDITLVNLENVLSEKFMTKVNIKQTKTGGTIEIKFLSNDDLDRLLKFIME